VTKLAGQPEDTNLAASLADTFMFQEYYRDRAPEFLGNEFGPNFALAVAKISPGRPARSEPDLIDNPSKGEARDTEKIICPWS
jgi:hypothetical protein